MDNSCTICLAACLNAYLTSSRDAVTICTLPIYRLFVVPDCQFNFLYFYGEQEASIFCSAPDHQKVRAGPEHKGK